MISTITSKGQLTIPKPIRDRLKLSTGDKIEFLIDEQGRVSFVAVTASITQLRGMAPKPKKPVTLARMQDAIEQEGGKL